MSDDVPTLVLDTQVVLDWLLFDNPHCALLTLGLQARRLRWIASPPMRDELRRVLERPAFASRQPQAGALWRRWEAHCEPVGPAAGTTLPGLRCSDPDDQPFIDLAVAHGARWLLSRDRAVLKVAARAKAVGLAVLTPQAWSASCAATSC